MSRYSDRIKGFLTDNNIEAEFLEFDKSVHSVQEAVDVSGFSIDKFTKSIVMLTDDDDLVIAVVPAENRVSTKRVRKALNLPQRPRIINAAESEKLLEQQLGGNSPLNAPAAKIFIDPNVLGKEWVLIGGGDDQCLVKISIKELTRVVTYAEARVRK